MNHDITASYIKCHADSVGCSVFEIKDPRFKRPVRVLAASNSDAVAELETQIWALRAIKSPLLIEAKKVRCDHCDGTGEVEVDA